METNFYQQLCDQEQQLKKTLDAISTLKAHYVKNPTNGQLSVGGVNKNTKSLEYNKNLTLAQKTLAVFGLINEGTADDVALKLSELDTNLSFEKAKKIAVFNCSNLYRAGKLKANKTGRKYVYSI